MIIGINNEELRTICKKNIENFELWSRRIIDKILVEEFGSDYFNAKLNENEFYFKTEIRKKAKKRLNAEPHKFNRLVDTLLLDDIIYIFTKDVLYKKCFKEVLDLIYPIGCNNIRVLMEKLIEQRNNLSHSNPISIRQAEQIICYTNDFIEGYKLYFKNKGEESVWNVPQIIKFTDSNGYENNKFDYKNFEEIFETGHIFYVGEKYQIELVVDPSFDSSEYEIEWKLLGNENKYRESKFSVEFDDKHVSQNVYIYCTVISKKEWHRHKFHDHKIAIKIQVLPNK